MASRFIRLRLAPRLLAGLERLRLLRLVFRVAESLKARRSGAGAATEHGGLPLPPPKLRVLVGGSPSAGSFVRGGEKAAGAIRATLARNDAHIGDLDSILDFGCGCGRVARHWASLDRPRLFGTDYNPALVEWCRKHLPFVEASTNGLEPPLAYEDGQFDLVYALSVFTHLGESLQHRWMAEFRRVIRPGGWLLLSTHGDAYLDRLLPAERERFDGGAVVVRHESVAGANVCSAFHPRSYVEQELADGFRVADVVASGAAGSGRQDLYLLQRS